MKNPLSKFFGSTKKSLKNSVSDSATPMWIGATVVLAVLFFLSAIFDLKIHVSLGQPTTVTTGVFQTAAPASQQSAPAGGIASQVGGC